MVSRTLSAQSYESNTFLDEGDSSFRVEDYDFFTNANRQRTQDKPSGPLKEFALPAKTQTAAVKPQAQPKRRKPRMQSGAAVQSIQNKEDLAHASGNVRSLIRDELEIVRIHKRESKQQQ